MSSRTNPTVRPRRGTTAPRSSLSGGGRALRSLGLAAAILLVTLLPGCDTIACQRPHGPPVEVLRGSLRERLDTYMRRAQGFGFSGALLVARGGEIVLHQGYGLADRRRGIPVTSSTVFDIESVCKQFTAVAILKLAGQGKVGVADPITRYFGQVPPDKAHITLHQLLTHTSGLPNEYHGTPGESRDQAVRNILALPLGSSPGRRFNYSDAGYNLLAAIVDAASGSYEDYLRRELFLPAGLTATGFKGERRWPDGTVAHSYNRDTDYGSPDTWDHTWDDRGAGDVISSVGDLYRWELAMRGDRILPAAARRQLAPPHVAASTGWSYGYGWNILRTAGGRTVIYHSGNLPPQGFTAEYRRYPEEGTVLLLTVNAMVDELGLLQAVRGDLEALLLGGDPRPRMPPFFAELPAHLLERYAGSYELASGGRLDVTPERGGL
ncbi:MAG: serine hydrolase, partial [Acidobacteriota bacterium]|nr:serine hydrolase [Acidobacteriota bacterium]